MSVLAYKREESKVQFLENARKLEIFALTHTVKFPKRYAFTITNTIINLSISLHNNLKSANSIFPTNGSEVRLRREFLTKANCDLQSLLSQLDIAMEMFNSIVSSSTWCAWIELISQEAKLISSVKKADKERYAKLPD